MAERAQQDTRRNVPAEQSLPHNQDYWMSVIASAMDAIITIDQDQNILIFNHAAEQMFGYRAAEITGQTIQLLLPERYRERHQEHIRRFGEMGLTSRTMGHLGKLYARRANGEEFPIEASISKIEVNGRLNFTVILRDITERVRAEDALQAKTDEITTMTRQLWQTAKLATMGELAASIAHELNNPLAILSLRIESLKSKLRTAEPLVQELSIMEGEVERMAALIANLLQFSRSSQRQLSTLDLREEVDRTLELIQGHLSHRQITVEKDYSRAAPMVIVDRQQMRQVFLNLFSNASDAMPQGGLLAIRIFPVDEGRGVQVQIADTGVGIAPENLDQITEPFYTTKEEGKGTGLGLAICRRIVEEHSGTLFISSPGFNQGTTVSVNLPISGASTPSMIQD